MYNKVPASPSGAWASSCLCASFRAFRFARPYLGGQQSHFSPLTAPAAVGEGAGFPIPHRTINSEREREATALLSWRPLHNRPAGVVWQVPGFVGNPAADIVSKINPSTTLIQKFGVLRGGAPKCPFAYFSGMGKVGPRRVEPSPFPHENHRIPHPIQIKELFTMAKMTPRTLSGFMELLSPLDAPHPPGTP